MYNDHKRSNKRYTVNIIDTHGAFSILFLKNFFILYAKCMYPVWLCVFVFVCVHVGFQEFGETKIGNK